MCNDAGCAHRGSPYRQSPALSLISDLLVRARDMGGTSSLRARALQSRTQREHDLVVTKRWKFGFERAVIFHRVPLASNSLPPPTSCSAKFRPTDVQGQQGSKLHVR